MDRDRDVRRPDADEYGQAFRMKPDGRDAERVSTCRQRERGRSGFVGHRARRACHDRRVGNRCAVGGDAQDNGAGERLRADRRRKNSERDQRR